MCLFSTPCIEAHRQPRRPLSTLLSLPVPPLSMNGFQSYSFRFWDRFHWSVGLVMVIGRRLFWAQATMVLYFTPSVHLYLEELF